MWILKLLTDYSVSAQRWFQWKRWSTWMCYIWALNLVHVKKTSPTFYYEIVVELSRLCYWMMNGRIRNPRYYHDDDSKTSDWNWWKDTKIERVKELVWKKTSQLHITSMVRNVEVFYLPQTRERESVCENEKGEDRNFLCGLAKVSTMQQLSKLTGIFQSAYGQAQRPFRYWFVS